MKIYKYWFLLALLLYSSNSFGQDFEEVNYPIIVANEELKNGFLGGITNPQFSNIDFDGDGILDLFVFDRNGNRVYTFLQKGGVGESSFEHAPQYESYFPKLNFWALLIDYNGDGIVDIFTAPLERDESGITVYKGTVTSGDWSFSRVTFDDPLDVLHYNTVSPTTGEDIREKIFVAHNSDIPAIYDVDYDGDIDILSFEPDGNYLLYYKNYAVENNLSLDNLVYNLGDDCWGKFQESGSSDSIVFSINVNECANQIIGHEEPVATVRHSGSSICAFDGDGDGDTDAVIGDIGSSSVVYLENGGNKDFAYVTEANYNYPESQKVDQFIYPSTFYVDINNDGNRDLVSSVNTKEIGINKNHIWYYENTNTDASPSFTLSSKSLLIDESINIGRYTAPTFVDYNSDGLMDILVGSSGNIIDEESEEIGMYLFENIGTLTHPIFELIDTDYLGLSTLLNSSKRLAPTFGDLDNDGDLDILIGDQNGRLCYMENQSGQGQPMIFDEFFYPYFDIKIGTNATPQIIDINKDGLMDIVIGERNNNQILEPDVIFGSLNYFQNTGNPSNPQFDSDQAMEPNTEVLGQTYFPGDNSNTPHFYQNNEDILLFTGSFSGNIRVFDNILNTQDSFHLKTDSLGNINIGNNTIIAVYDIDSDNYLELLIGNARGGLDFYNTPYSIDGIDTKTTEIITSEITIYPNPTSSNFYIRTSEILSNVTLLDLTGREVKQWNGFHQEQFSIDAELKGTYYLSIRTMDGRKIMSLLILQ